MALDATQVVSNVKRSFNRHIADSVEPASVNFDEDPFDTDDLTSWFSVRYTGYRSEPAGMGDSIDEQTDAKGRIHRIGVEVGAWCRDDPQRLVLGDMADKILSACSQAAIALYDFTDPENPVEIGTLYLQSKEGKFTPTWSSGGVIRKSSSDAHLQARMVGYVLELDLVTIAEVG